MLTKSILAGAAIALAATVGSASAAERFATLDGIAAEPMGAAALSSVRGGMVTIYGIPSASQQTVEVEIVALQLTANMSIGHLTVLPLKPAEFREVLVIVGGGLTK